jgi:V8-like Glu-specific endopeptidase
MQRIERIFGFKVTLDDALDSYRFDILKERASLILAREEFDPEQYHLYFHNLTITLRKHHFAAKVEIVDRIKELQLTFARNPKQDRNHGIRFFNHLLVSEESGGVPTSPTEAAVTYYLSGEYLAAHLTFRNELITFISKDLRTDHRKIKISLHIFPTTSFAAKLRTTQKEYVTKLDLRYERYTPVNVVRPFQTQENALHAPVSPESSDIGNVGVERQGGAVNRPTEMSSTDRNMLRDVMANLASNSGDSKVWFRSIVSDSDLPQTFKQSIGDVYTGASRSDAGRVIDYAFSRGVQPDRPQFTALGAILKAVIESDIGLESAQLVAALIMKYWMYRDPVLLRRLHQRYGLPVTLGSEQGGDSLGFWLGPELSDTDVQLQRFFQPQSDFWDVGFLTRGLQCVGSVCRIEVPLGNPLGTGFLVGNDKLLTNFHVLKLKGSDSLEENVAKAVFRFRNVSAPNGQEAGGQIFRAVGTNPILTKSSSDQLDFVLIQLDPSITSRPDIGKASLLSEIPSEGAPLNILQHPNRGPMSLAISKDGIRSVFQDRGLVQYVTRASGGSSGSPCFNDDWRVIAIHHAARARAFGAVREGILMNKIYPDIQHYIK